MNLECFADMASELMVKYLSFSNYKFDFMRFYDNQCLGRCFPDSTHGLIEFNIPFVLNNNENVCKDVILHEISHALAHYYSGGTYNHGHDRFWQVVATQLGCSATQFMKHPEYIRLPLDIDFNKYPKEAGIDGVLLSKLVNKPMGSRENYTIVF